MLAAATGAGAGVGARVLLAAPKALVLLAAVGAPKARPPKAAPLADAGAATAGAEAAEEPPEEGLVRIVRIVLTA